MILLVVVFVVLAVSYVAAAPDRHTHAVSRGLAGAIWSGVQAGNARVQPAGTTKTVTKAGPGTTSGTKTRTAGTKAKKATLWSDIKGAYDWAKSVVLWSAAFVAAVGPAYQSSVETARTKREGRRSRRAERKEKRRQKRAEKQIKKNGGNEKKDPVDEAIEKILDEATEWPGWNEPAPAEGGPENPGEKEQGVTEAATETGGEYTAVGDMNADLAELEAAAEEAIGAMGRLAAIRAAINSKYEAADFSTGNLTTSVVALTETESPDSVLELIPAARDAVSEAEGLGDHVTTIEAEGKTESYTPN